MDDHVGWCPNSGSSAHNTEIFVCCSECYSYQVASVGTLVFPPVSHGFGACSRAPPPLSPCIAPAGGTGDGHSARAARIPHLRRQAVGTEGALALVRTSSPCRPGGRSVSPSLSTRTRRCRSPRRLPGNPTPTNPLSEASAAVSCAGRPSHARAAGGSACSACRRAPRTGTTSWCATAASAPSRTPTATSGTAPARTSSRTRRTTTSICARIASRCPRARYAPQRLPG